VLIGNLARGWVDKPHLKDPSNWPPQMREEWGDDRGAAVGKAAQAHQIEQFRKLRGALDEFRPDFMVFIYRDIAEAFKNFAKPPYWIHAHDQLDVKLFQIHGNRENYWEEDPDRVDTIYGHPEAAAYLTRKLQDAGLNPLCCPESMAPLGLGHNALAGVVHLDWDRREFKTPFIPIGVDPFGFFRTRNNEGLSPWNRDLPRPLLPKEAFNLGREIARAFRPSPWRVALVGVTAWSHAKRERQRLGVRARPPGPRGGSPPLRAVAEQPVRPVGRQLDLRGDGGARPVGAAHQHHPGRRDDRAGREGAVCRHDRALDPEQHVGDDDLRREVTAKETARWDAWTGKWP
jgi:hypothetical protein